MSDGFCSGTWVTAIMKLSKLFHGEPVTPPFRYGSVKIGSF
jgi:hypothetical protein